MKKKLVAMMMVTTLSVSVLAGCGSKTNEQRKAQVGKRQRRMRPNSQLRLRMTR